MRAFSALLALLFLGACAGAVPEIPHSLSARGEEALARARSLSTSVQRIVDAGWNPSRRAAIETRAAELGLEESLRTEWIDWFSFQKNAVIEIPGETPSIVYIVAHYDKTDVNPLKLASILLDGVLDEAIAWSYFSDGGIDNATGVAVALELAATLRELPLRKTYRILLTGSEESGLRGSTTHAARLGDQEWERLSYVVNIDTVGLAESPNCVTTGVESLLFGSMPGEIVSYPGYVSAAFEAAKRTGIPLEEGQLPIGASGDYAAFKDNGFLPNFGRSFLFNLVGALLPQRLWFAPHRKARVVNFSSCEIIDIGDYLAGQILLPTGSLHGPRDDAERVDPVRLYEQYALILEMLQSLDAQ